MIEQITKAIKGKLKATAPILTPEQELRRNRILNSDNPNFFGHGHKMPEIEKIVKITHDNYQCTYDDAVEVFKNLIKSDIHEEKFAGVYFLNRFKRYFNESTIDTIQEQYAKYCDSWAICDSTMLKVVGPFLAKKNNEKLAEKTIDKWSDSKNLWIRRASMVILLKIIMINKEFEEARVFNMVEKMRQYSEDYIQKGVGRLLKTCSRYEPDLIFEYLQDNKDELPRLILRYASEKLPKEKRAQILKK